MDDPWIRDHAIYEVERNGKIFIDTIADYYTEKHDLKVDQSEKWQILENNVAYVNLDLIEKKDVDDMMEDIMQSKAIIFDNRGYPNGTMYAIAEYLNASRFDFAQFTVPIKHYPGKFEWLPYISACGKENGVEYKGKVIIMVNEQTQSHAEFATMCMQTHPNAVTIGSQTAGADGNVSFIPMLGGRKTYMSGIGVYYPDRTPTQRVGIKVDMEVKPTLEGLLQGRDEVLEKAIAVANESL